MSAEQRVHYIGNLEKHYRMVNKIKSLINLDARLKKFSHVLTLLKMCTSVSC